MYNRKKHKGHNHVWLSVVLLGCWLAVGVACPLYCRCVDTLYIYCDQSGISDSQFVSLIESSPREATFIDLSQNNLTTLPENIFSKFSELVIVDASHNAIRTIPNGVFENLPVFQKITLDGNKLSNLPNRTFENLPHLKEVHLHGNRISFIDICAFSETPKLEKLVLSHNQLISLSADNLTSLHTLLHLDVSHNQIETLSDTTFSDLVNLKTLQVSHNRISSLTSLTFQGLNDLEQLYLDHNEIHELYSDFFLQFRQKLKKLSMSYNKIRILRSELFKGMSFLEKLDLSYNNINYLGNNIVPGLSLTEVNLRGNKLEEITQKAFGLTRKISDLNLSCNEIRTIASGAFSNFKESVYKLNLESNQLQEVVTGVFDGMKYLQSLNLANNSISFIEEGAFQGLINLNYLDLSHNSLRNVSQKMFAGAVALKSLELYHNLVTTFQWPDFTVYQSKFVINLNLSFENVTYTSAKVIWPYKDGSQIYWSRYVKCVEAEFCPFRIQAEYLASYSKELIIGNFSPSSTYYVCVNPEFKRTNIKLQQCGIIVTPKLVHIETTEEPPVTEASISRAPAISSQLMHLQLCLLLVVYSLL